MKFRSPLSQFDKKTSNINSLGLLILRLCAAIPMLAFHGFPKLKNFTYLTENFSDPIGLGPFLSISLAVFAEFICAFLLSLGLFTRFSSFCLFFTMAVAYFVVHGEAPFGKKELAFVYGAMYLAIIFTGPGKFSIDKSLK